MAQPNRMTIHIGGIRYPIKTLEEPAYVAALAQELDDAVRELIENGSASLNEALLLSALSYLDAQKKAESGADNLRRQVTEYAEEAAKARLEAQELRRELERLGRKGQNGKNQGGKG